MRAAFPVLLLGLLGAFLAPGCGQGRKGPARLAFSAIRDQDATRLEARFDPVARYLAEALGVEVEYVPTSDYRASVEMFANGDLQLAWFGGLTGVQARGLVPGARAIAMGEEDRAFRSYFIANRDTGIERSKTFPLAMRGRTFTFGSESSTSGRLMPEHFLRLYTGQGPEAFFSRVLFSGDHDQTAELVQAGAVEVGAINALVYDRRVREGETDPAICRVVWETPPYADYNFTAHPMLEAMFGPGFIDRLQRALVAMDDPELLAAFPRKRLVPASNEDFRGIEEVARTLHFLD
ncbi:MAG: putative selenate ABC transporter substrate-binding protein [Planctomycetota bacterium]